MIQAIYWMAFTIAAFVCWDEILWIRILLISIAGVCLGIAERAYQKQKDKIAELEEQNHTLLDISKKLLKVLKLHDQTLDMLTHQVETLDKKEFKGEEE